MGHISGSLRGGEMCDVGYEVRLIRTSHPRGDLQPGAYGKVVYGPDALGSIYARFNVDVGPVGPDGEVYGHAQLERLVPGKDEWEVFQEYRPHSVYWTKRWTKRMNRAHALAEHAIEELPNCRSTDDVHKLVSEVADYVAELSHAHSSEARRGQGGNTPAPALHPAHWAEVLRLFDPSHAQDLDEAREQARYVLDADAVRREVGT
jgi:hypothetical protein